MLVIIIAFAIVITIVIVAIFINAQSMKCPNCKGYELEYEKRVEKERYDTTKMVKDEVKDRDGKLITTIEKILPITIVVYEEYYKCRNCGHIVIREKKEEL